MDIKIRAIRLEDAEGINALRVMDGVRENILIVILWDRSHSDILPNGKVILKPIGFSDIL